MADNKIKQINGTVHTGSGHIIQDPDANASGFFRKLGKSFKIFLLFLAVCVFIPLCFLIIISPPSWLGFIAFGLVVLFVLFASIAAIRHNQNMKENDDKDDTFFD